MGGRYRRGAGNFTDYLIAETATDSGCRGVVTFDVDLWQEEDFEAP